MKNRLDIILETVGQILEDAKRARERRKYRASQATKTYANYIENLRMSKGSPSVLGSRMRPGEADENFETMALVIPHSGARWTVAERLRELRKTNPAAAIRLLNVQSGREPNEPTKMTESFNNLYEGAKRARERREYRERMAQGGTVRLGDMLQRSLTDNPPHPDTQHPGWNDLLYIVRHAVQGVMKHSKERKDRAESLRTTRGRRLTHDDKEFAQRSLNLDSGRNQNDPRT
jgi:hypothetical protein